MEDQEAAQRRWDEVLNRFFEVLPEDLWDRAEMALTAGRGPLWDWLQDMHRGRSRLPTGLTPDVMRRLVLIRLDEADLCEPWQAVCLRCGLQYPTRKPPPLSEWKLAPDCSPDERPLRYVLPSFFDHDGCPACGASSKAGTMNWAHLMADGFWTTDRHNGSGDEGAAEADGSEGEKGVGNTGSQWQAPTPRR
jgi:hypothetical protein